MIVYDSVYADMNPGLSLRIKQMAPVLAACGCKASYNKGIVISGLAGLR